MRTSMKEAKPITQLISKKNYTKFRRNFKRKSKKRETQHYSRLTALHGSQIPRRHFNRNKQQNPGMPQQSQRQASVRQIHSTNSNQRRHQLFHSPTNSRVFSTNSQNRLQFLVSSNRATNRTLAPQCSSHSKERPKHQASSSNLISHSFPTSSPQVNLPCFKCPNLLKLKHSLNPQRQCYSSISPNP